MTVINEVGGPWIPTCSFENFDQFDRPWVPASRDERTVMSLVCHVTSLSHVFKIWSVTVTSLSQFFRDRRVTVTSLSRFSWH